MLISRVRVTPEGLAYRQWDPAAPDGADAAETLVRPHTFGQLAPFFDAMVEFDERVTLGDLFTLLDLGEDRVLLEVVLGEPVTSFLEAALAGGAGREAAGSGPRAVPIDTLIGRQPVALVIHNDFDTVPVDTGHATEVAYGVRRVTEAVDSDGDRLSLETLPLETLLRLPLRYDDRLRLWASQDARRDRHAPVFTARWTLTFVEALRALFWDLSFQGTPSERAAVQEALAEVPGALAA